MSKFLRKSASQCSFANGDDQITVRRIDQIDVNRNSRAEMNQSTTLFCPSGEPSDSAVHDSCVIRNFSKHKSSQLRFLAWVAYTRKYTDEYITEDERRTCPLLWCRSIFESQEAMLQHVYGCPNLSKGLYWCFHCQKPERVGKFSCKRCQGVPSKTDRMASVAKKIFSKLGVKAHRYENAIFSSPAEIPKSHETLEDIDTAPPYFQDPLQQDTGMDWSQSEAQELPNTSIVPEMAGDCTAASHELADTYISEMVGTECPIELGDGMPNWEDNFYAENFDEWHLPELPVASKGGSSPKLFLDTSVAQATPSLNWTNTPLSAAIISPMSAVLRCGSTRSAVEISPTDSEASGNSFLTDSGYSSATTLSASYSTSSFQRFPSLGSVTDRKGKKRETDFEVFSEEWINDTVCSVALPIPDVAALPPPHLEPIFEDPPKIIHSAGRCTEYPNTKFESPHWHDPASLLQSFLDVLDLHIKHTENALQDLPLKTTTQELMSMSRTSMVSVGFEVLAGILAGRHPTTTVQVFAFTHVACALAIAIDGSEAKIHTQRWFQDSLNWASGLQGEKQKRGYEVIAKTIWEPPELLGPNSSFYLASDSGENSLFASCKHFLDLFESLDSPKLPIHVPSSHSSFNFAQSSFEQRAKTHFIEELIRKPRIEAFIEDVVRVEARLSQGLITSIRQLELELICAGKLASQSDRAYARFLEHVTALCDVLYREESSGVTRTKCQLRSARRIMVLTLQEVCRDASEHGWKGNSGFHELSDGDEDLLLPFLDMDFRSDRGRETDLGFDMPNSMAAFNADADDLLLDLSNYNCTATQHHQSHPHPHPHTSRRTTPPRPENHHGPHPTPPNITLTQPTPTLKPTLIAAPSRPATIPPLPTLPSSHTHRCQYCSYAPAGEHKWKASNLRRHQRIQHPNTVGESKLYVCRWRGCQSRFTRSDNLRCHVREKGHFEGAEEGRGGKRMRRVEGG
ncbi:hypothetical protein LZ554_001033 [Drepanopeziza brunnea f. sp. 'monogermtubi']|nr:hypothetical protein LZ554_001033 [Drepanopeziza brunnea f. sp. 'monogermtubi']